MIAPEASSVMRSSFAVIDEREVILAVPGMSSIDESTYSTRFVLRHLIRTHDPKVAEVFSALHREIWSRSVSVSIT